MPIIAPLQQTVESIGTNDNSFLSYNPQRLRLTEANGTREVVFPFGPQGTRHAAVARKHTTLPRPFKAPLLINENPMLETISFSADIAIANTGGKTSIEPVLNTLIDFAKEGVVCEFKYANARTDKKFVITRMTYDITRRNTGGTPVRATTNLILTEAIIVTTNSEVIRGIPSDPIVSNSSQTSSEEPERTKLLEAPRPGSTPEEYTAYFDCFVATAQSINSIAGVYT